ncbi:toll-like receptor 13 [Tribolium castaneum]|uniref:toll-like receptor 13 n=1 Tax=Tribolium castaneum TaxID=7070 RepID=UPI00046C2666|nr:PREDICTED: toll-like receptor 13 [Tribolium castaneum]|eukprot:XP_008201257.1 PREDICTED: toll-like receptor 13 [Tribolium castaneum]
MFLIYLNILVLITKHTLGVCTVDNVRDSQGEISINQKYIYCRFENISSNFYPKIKSFFDYYNSDRLEWLEISNTDNRILSSVALGRLPVHDLRIHDANIHEIQPNAFSEVKNQITRLSLKNNKLSTVEDYYFEDLSLTDLDLSFNNITSIHEDSFLNSARNLETLILKNNFLSELPPRLFQHNHYWRLTHLDISFNKLVTFHDQIFFSLQSLVELRMNNNDLKYLDENIFSTNRKLNYLYINDNKLHSFDNLNLATSIIRLINASHNAIHFLNFSNNVDIETLDLSSNGINKNFSLANATISHLLLDNNNLESTHDTFFTYFPSLSDVSLANNKLKQLNPNLFNNIKRLTKLNLAKNYLRSNDLSNVPKLLNDLRLSSNNLTEITFQSLHGFKHLQVLHLDHNQIRKIALGSFKDLNQLTELYLSSNKFTVLDMGVFVGLNSLKYLDLSYNDLHQISGNIFYNLRALKVVNFSKTKVKYSNLEEILIHLPNVEQVGLADNDWACSRIVNIIHKFGKKVIDVGDYNITNVEGVACHYEEIVAKNSVSLNRSETTINIDRVVSKFDTIVVLLIFLNVMFGFILLLTGIYLSFKFISFISKSNTRNNYSITNYDQELEL